MHVSLRTVLSLLVLAFLVYAIVVSPERAADVVQGVWDILTEAVLRIGRFLRDLL